MTNMTPEEFREHLKELGLNQSAFARQVKISRGTVNRWTRGEIGIPGLAAAYIRLLVKDRRMEK